MYAPFLHHHNRMIDAAKLLMTSWPLIHFQVVFFFNNLKKEKEGGNPKSAERWRWERKGEKGRIIHRRDNRHMFRWKLTLTILPLSTAQLGKNQTGRKTLKLTCAILVARKIILQLKFWHRLCEEEARDRERERERKRDSEIEPGERDDDDRR